MGRVLCADYASLTSEGKRKARIAACTPFKGMTPEDFSASFSFFLDYFLCRDPDSEDVAEFFPPPRLPSPPLHAQLVADIARYQKHLFIHPRYFGKSIIFSEAIPLWLCLTNRKFDALIVCSSSKNTQRRLSNISRQILHNPRIIEDFGMLKAPRGDASWSQSALNLTNGSSIIGAPITSKLHGHHPAYCVLDDIESDPDDSSMGLSDPVRLRANIERSIFRTILPALRRGKVIVWIGTTHDRSSLIWQAYNNQDDPRWKAWNKDKKAIYFDDADGERHYLWKEMYTPEFIESQIKEIGPSAFNAEFMGAPASEQDRLLAFNDKWHNYWCKQGPHPSEEDCDPLESKTLIAWNQRGRDEDGNEKVIRQEQVAGGKDGLFSNMYRVMTVDWGRAVTNTADFSCIMITGIDKKKHWWVLDLWLGRVTNDKLVEKIYHYGKKWRTQLIGIESASIGKQLNERVYTDLVEARDWPVRVRAIKYPAGMSKEDRIANMEWRFNRNYIHMPGDLANQKHWKMLRDQINYFTLDGKNLEFDDAVDTLSMVNLIYRTPSTVADREDRKLSLAEKLRNGETMNEMGVPYISGMNPNDISDEMVAAMREKHEEENPDEDLDWRQYGFN